MSSSSTHLLPAGITTTFTSRYIDAGELRLHAVIPDTGHWVAEQGPRRCWLR